jgi:S1-C subfamily serine protease
MRSARFLPKSVGRQTLAVLLVLIVVLSSLAAYYSIALTAERGQALNPAQIYAMASHSVVAIQGVREEVVDSGGGPVPTWVGLYASGFVVKYSGSYYLVTNFHVVDSLVNTTVTFWNGDSFRGKIVGTDAYSDLGIVSVQAPSTEFQPLEIASSSALSVGEPCVAIGNPYGLAGTITYGVVSQTGRTISYDTGSGSTSYPIADAIQFSAAINPGNSGGPLLDTGGRVVGITTAAVSGAEGLGFAIPSDTILREFPTLIATGKYVKHPYLGVEVTDMSYELSKLVGANVTYGVLIVNTTKGSPAAQVGLKSGSRSVDLYGATVTIGGDVIVSINGTRIVNYDSFSTYLERHTLPGQVIQLGIIRSGVYMVINVVLGARPPPT